MSTSATYTHLRDGSWGVRLVGTAKQNQVVTVVKKDGTSKTEIVARVLWTGRDSKSGQTISLCTLAAQGGSGTYADKHGYNGGSNAGTVRCRHCGKRTAEGDDWCMVCGRADYEA